MAKGDWDPITCKRCGHLAHFASDCRGVVSGTATYCPCTAEDVPVSNWSELNAEAASVELATVAQRARADALPLAADWVKFCAQRPGTIQVETSDMQLMVEGVALRWAHLIEYGTIEGFKLPGEKGDS